MIVNTEDISALLTRRWRIGVGQFVCLIPCKKKLQEQESFWESYIPLFFLMKPLMNVSACSSLTRHVVGLVGSYQSKGNNATQTRHTGKNGRFCASVFFFFCLAMHLSHCSSSCNLRGDLLDFTCNSLKSGNFLLLQNPNPISFCCQAYPAKRIFMMCLNFWRSYEPRQQHHVPLGCSCQADFRITG